MTPQTAPDDTWQGLLLGLVLASVFWLFLIFGVLLTF